MSILANLHPVNWCYMWVMWLTECITADRNQALSLEYGLGTLNNNIRVSIKCHVSD